MRGFAASLVMLAVGAVLVAAAFGAADRTAGGSKKGGTFRVSTTVEIFDHVDPAIAYLDSSWAIEFATCAKLYSYPDKGGSEGAQIIPEVATALPKISSDGKTLTVELKRTYRFHNGAQVTAANFVEAFNRDANPKMQSPATTYMHEIGGTDAVLAGDARSISGVRAIGNWTIEFKLTRLLPDFVARLTMPFFCPVRVGEAIEPKGISKPLGSGPYYVAERDLGRRTVLERNRFYRGPRPANVDRITFDAGAPFEACYLLLQRDQVDLCADGIPTGAYKEAADRYGINRKDGRFFVTTQLATRFLAFNHDRPAFKNNVALKKAINFAIDRPALARSFGYLTGKRTDQILPPLLGKNENIYPLKGADVATAKKWLVRARVKPDKLVLYTGKRTDLQIRAQIFQHNLKQIGIDLEVHAFDQPVRRAKCGTRGEPFDLCEEFWRVDYPDAVTYFDPLLNGNNLRETGNVNVAYYDNPKFNRDIERIARLTGDARARAWAELDVRMMKEDPPWAPFLVLNYRFLLSESSGCFDPHPVYIFNFVLICKR